MARERVELEATPEAEQAELAGIYRSRGLSAALADRVAAELSATDPLVHHAREELGLDLNALAQPVQAASVSATSFAVGALVPVITALAAPTWLRIQALMVVTLVALGSLGAFGAKLGGAPVRRAAVRVLVGGVVALVITTLIGRAIGASL